MEVEADLFLVFTGFDAKTTEAMTVAELMRWHDIALKRHQKALDEVNNAG